MKAASTNPMENTSRLDLRWQWLTAGAALLAGTAWLYWPGLHGAFLLDDYQNLKLLRDIQAPLTLGQVKTYVAAALAGPLNRPMALSSFALQYDAWPSNAFPFKAVNLVLHLMNGCLLFWLGQRVAALSGISVRRAQTAALLGAAVWMLHPLNVSTTLYVVQRMSELAALFTLAGLLAYVYGRKRCAVNPLAGTVWMSIGVALGTTLAVLSKENGILVPGFVLVVEATVLRGLERPPYHRLWMAVFVYAPLLLLAGYVVLTFRSQILPGYSARDFSLGQRLLTEPRAVMDYIRLFFAPRSSELGLFHDDYVPSRAFFDPPITGFALVGLAALAASAIGLRRRTPWFSFGVLWFLVGHSIESTFLPLELYFEHRNYLPLMGIGLSIGVAGQAAWYRLEDRRWRVALSMVMTAWLASLTVGTARETALWGNPVAQAAVWAQEHPSSLRAQERLGSVFAILGDYRRAAEKFAELAQGPLAYPAGYLQWTQAGCYDPDVPLPNFGEAASALGSARHPKAVVGAFEQIVIARELGECGRIPREGVTEMMSGFVGSPDVPKRQIQQTYGLMGRFEAADGRIDRALAALEKAYALSPSPETAVFQARLAFGAGQTAQARAYLKRARETFRAGLAQQQLRDEIDVLDRQIGAVREGRNY